MKTKTIVIITVFLSSLVTILWVLGLVFANINLFTIGMIILLISLYPAIRYFNDINEFFKKINDKVIEDERTEHIDEKAGLMSFAALIAVSFYVGVAILTLRNTYPEYVNLAYPFFIVFIMGLLTHLIIKAYYKRKYSD